MNSFYIRIMKNILIIVIIILRRANRSKGFISSAPILFSHPHSNTKTIISYPSRIWTTVPHSGTEVKETVFGRLSTNFCLMYYASVGCPASRETG